jgi:hypothetical protein
MPGDACNQPKATLCSESIKRFELEIALVPIENQVQYDINRNAQFRPHTDSGAGAGQSNHLIVGLERAAGNWLWKARPGIFRQGDRVQWVDGASLDNALRENASVWCVHQGPL